MSLLSNIKQVNPYGYFDKALNRHFSTVNEKKEFMKQNGIAEDGSMESEAHRTERIAAEINERRRKEGKEPRTVQQLVGTTRRVPKKLYFFT